MFGVFEIRLPYAVQNRLNTVGVPDSQERSLWGQSQGWIAAPCTGPALAVVLTYIATTGSLFLGFWLMFTYALGMGLLFIGIGTFSGVLSRTTTFRWMDVCFGKRLRHCYYYDGTLLSQRCVSTIARFSSELAAIFRDCRWLVLVGVWLGKLTQRFSGISPRMQFQKACGLLLAVFGAYMLVGGIQQPAGPHLDWVYDEGEGFEIAKRENKLVMLDFYASWCAACKELDHKTYADPAVAAKLDDYVSVKLDFTRQLGNDSGTDREVSDSRITGRHFHGC